MREIKFRAWDYTSSLMRTDINAINFNEDGSINQIDVYSGSNILFPDKECALMQFTGLKDKNGKEIYEGDVVEYKAYNIWHRDEVKFTDGKFHGNLNGVKEELQSRYDLGLIVTLGCEVIGNIYENPELLSEEGL